MKRILLIMVMISLFGYLTAQNETWDVYLRGHAVKSIDFENETVWAATDSFLVSLNKLDKSTTYYPYPDLIENMMGFLKTDRNGVKWIVRSEKLGLYPADVSIYGFDENKWDKIEFKGEGPILSLSVNNNKYITWDPFHPRLYKLAEGSNMQYTPENSDMRYRYVYALTTDSDGNLWFGNTNDNWIDNPNSPVVSLVKYDGANWTSYPGPSGYFQKIAFGEMGKVYIQTVSSSSWNDWSAIENVYVLDENDGSQLKFLSLSTDYSLQTIEVHDKLWFSSADLGVAVFDKSDWIYYSVSNSDLPSDTVYEIAIDSDGTKWIGTANGLAAFNENNLKGTVGVDSKILDDIELFPNPTNYILTLKIPNNLQSSTIDILNIQGKVIKSFCVNNNQNRLDVSHFPTGVYLVKIQSDENYILKKFVKQ